MTSASNPRLVIVVGSGRSGTSTVAGTLKYLGLHIPPPEIPPNPTNPRGFFEPRWVVDFHKRLLRRSGVHLSDSRPDAADRAREVGARPRVQTELSEWLGTALQDAPELVIKDPRNSWFQPMWREAAQSVEVTPRFLTMLRHPAEVAGSKQTYYARNPAADQRVGDTWRIAGWINMLQTVEFASRPDPRAFVRYDDLLTNWRSAMGPAGETLDLAYAGTLDPDKPHEVDDFIDPGLHRVKVTWDDLVVPSSIQEIAEATWQALGVLVDSGGHDEKAEATLDELRDRYGEVHAEAEAIAHHSLQAAAGKFRGGGPRKKGGAKKGGAKKGGAKKGDGPKRRPKARKRDQA
ncbi:MAG TPA: sulfotransferase family protein [Nocardioidaceae bacterium]|nr:sulfotransferase family protein [Nocardioidaceae bacterium]